MAKCTSNPCFSWQSTASDRPHQQLKAILSMSSSWLYHPIRIPPSFQTTNVVPSIRRVISRKLAAITCALQKLSPTESRHLTMSKWLQLANTAHNSHSVLMHHFQSFQHGPNQTASVLLSTMVRSSTHGERLGLSARCGESSAPRKCNSKSLCKVCNQLVGAHCLDMSL